MKPSEAATLLGVIARWDNRTVGETNAIAWSQSLDADIGMRDATDAAAAHFAECGDVWIMPSHINRRVRDVLRDRVRRAGLPPIPGGLEYGREQAWRRLWIEAVKSDAVDPAGVADAALGVKRPEVTARPLDLTLKGLTRAWSA